MITPPQPPPSSQHHHHITTYHHIFTVTSHHGGAFDVVVAPRGALGLKGAPKGCVVFVFAPRVHLAVNPPQGCVGLFSVVLLTTTRVHLAARATTRVDHGFVGYPFHYRVTLGFGSIVGGIDHVNHVIRLPLEHDISRANVVLMNAIALLRLAIGSSVGRNDGTTRPESSCGNLAGDY
ncbi:hypothetical protein Tco_0659048 [Tanacetum coccineum]